MTVSLQQTTNRYRGRKAATYEDIRTKQRRWHVENTVVARMMQGAPIKTGGLAVLDIPFGTGRFVELYHELKLSVTGVDSSDEMLALARNTKRIKPGTVLFCQDVLQFLGTRKDAVYCSAVCVRFLDLIDEDAMHEVVSELCRVTRDRVILTIRLGKKYVPKVYTATHSEEKFKQCVATCGWVIAESHPVFNAGWYVMKLTKQRRRNENRTNVGAGVSKKRRVQLSSS